MICVGSGSDLATASGPLIWPPGSRTSSRRSGSIPITRPRSRMPGGPLLDKLARSPRVVGVGETGLDYFYDHSPRDKQAEVFRRFLALSRAVRRPFICHVRDAHEDALAILRAESLGEAGGVVHCFSGNSGPCARLPRSRTGPFLLGNPDFQERRRDPPRGCLRASGIRSWWRPTRPILRRCPIAESATSPAFVVKTLEALASVRGIPFSRAAEATTQNAQRRFALPAVASTGGTILSPPAG